MNGIPEEHGKSVDSIVLNAIHEYLEEELTEMTLTLSGLIEQENQNKI